jgi:hypothetical protein
MAEVIGAEMQLEPIRCGLALKWHDDASVIDQHFESVVAGSHALSECANRVEVR